MNKYLLLILFFISTNGRAESHVKIGVLIPLSGDTATTYGDSVRQGVELAAKQNPNSHVNVVYEDSACSSKVAVTGAKKLIERDKVSAIIGDVCWTDVIAPITEQAKVIVVSTGSAQSEVREAGDFVFRLKTDVAVDSRELARRIFNEVGLKSAAVICVDDNWGQGIASNFVDEFQKIGGTIVWKGCSLPTETDFRTVLTRVRSSAPQVLVIAAYPSMTGVLLRQALQLKVAIPKAAYRGGVGPETLVLAGDAAEGLMVVDEFDPLQSAESGRKFVDAFKVQYGMEPSLFSAMGYDAYNLISQAFDTCSSNTECMRDFLYGLRDYKGASGVLSFDEKGDIEKKLTFKKLSGGKFVQYRGSYSNNLQKD